MPHMRVEGNDVESIYEACKVAVERARPEAGRRCSVHTVPPVGPFEGDTQAYRGDSSRISTSRDPIPAYREAVGVRRDPRRRHHLGVKAEAEAEVEAAIAYAKESPEPKPSDAYLHVFA